MIGLSATELSQKLKTHEATSVDATQACLKRIEAVDPKVKAFIRFDAERALTKAKASDDRRKKGEARGPLDGIPVALKDIFCTQGWETSCGSKILSGFVPPYDATAVARLERAGAVIVGKTNMDEFAMGSSTENSAHFPTHNPYAPERTPGGSSGGSAAAVAAREIFAALGTDTGGSIRQPAAFCNVVGIKPTYGRVSRHGMVAFASSLDQGGPIGKTVGDVAMVLSAISGADPLDMTSSRHAVPDFTVGLHAGVKGLKVGLPKEYFGEGLDAEVEASVRAAVKTLEGLGAQVREVSLPHTAAALPTYYLLAPAEASSNLARYDGVRYGFRAKDVQGLRELYFETRTQGFGVEVKRRIMLGTFALSAGYYDAYYRKAQQVRTLVKRDFEAAFREVDVLAAPVSPMPPFKLGEKADDPMAMYLADVLTVPVNLAGLPALSLPCGFTQGKLPVGLQLIGKAFDESTVLRAAAAYEAAHPFWKEEPKL
ncbi:MAG: Asp-tRNA(Asn)/Glu-tRNA(Gln) amidotransferase subunit GatA [Myxococcaceae bacterium]